MSATWDGKPTKSTIGDNDYIPITDGDTGTTKKYLGSMLKAQAGSSPASGSSAGTMSSAHYTKVEALDAQATRDSKDAELQAWPFFFAVATVANGTVRCLRVPTGGGTYTLGTFTADCDSGTVTLDIKKNGSTITGLGSMSVTSSGVSASPSSTTTITAGDLLQLTFSSNSSCVNFDVDGLLTKTIS